MKDSLLPVGCACCPMNRRNFLAAGSAAACACSLGFSLGTKSTFAAEGSTADSKRIRVFYSLLALQQSRATWPNIGFDFRPVVEEMNTLTTAFPETEFLFANVDGPEQIKPILEKDKAEKIDAYIVFQMNNRVPRVIYDVVKAGKPTLYADCPYCGTGHFLTSIHQLLAKKPTNFGYIASLDFDDVLHAVRCFQTCTDPNGFADAVAAVRKANTPAESGSECKADHVKTIPIKQWKKQIANSKILAFKDNEPPSGNMGDIAGIPLMYLPFRELNDAWKNADRDQAREVAARWAKCASKIEDVSQAEIENSAAMYLGQKALLKKYDADAITINCLGGFYGGHIHAYPCLGFHELCNEGLIGGCECDIRSAAAMIAWKTLTAGRTGFISDPVLDQSKREIIYAHCVASNRAFGPDGPANPYEILTHSEDRQGAAVRSLYPEGYMTTTIALRPDQKKILLHQAKTTGNSLEDKACRTKLRGEVVGDFEKLYTEWDHWHRVTVYGDLKDQVHDMADALGWTVNREA